jgi:hypothetical protein
MPYLFCTATLLLIATWLSAAAQAQASEPTPPKDKAQLHLFLLIGQSNMAGRGRINPAENTTNPHIWMLDRNEQWVLAKDPLHFDTENSGVGLGMTFAKTVLEKNPNIHIGLIPCAVGGTPIRLWAIREKLAVDALRRAKKGLEAGTLKGILWHQGESDTSDELVKVYGEKLTALVTDFRRELTAPNIPFIAGELPQPCADASEAGKKMKETLNALAKTVHHFGCASSKGLTTLADNVHFDTAAQCKLGRRYAEIYLTMKK